MEYTSEMLYMKYVYECALKNDGCVCVCWGVMMLHNTRNGFGSERNEVDPADILDILR